MTRRWLPQSAGSPSLNVGGAATAAHPFKLENVGHKTDS